MFFEATRYFSSFDEIGLSRVESCCFEHTGRLEEEAISCEARDGLLPTAWSRRDIPIDCRYLDFLLRRAEDPEVGLGAQSVRVGPGARLPRLPALYLREEVAAN